MTPEKTRKVQRRNARIYWAFNGRNYEELSDTFGLSPHAIRQIIGQQAAACVAPATHGLGAPAQTTRLLAQSESVEQKSKSRPGQTAAAGARRHAGAPAETSSPAAPPAPQMLILLVPANWAGNVRFDPS